MSSDYLYDADPNIAGLQLCGFEQPGTYTVKATGEWYDDDFNTHPMSLAPAKIAVRRPASHTTAKPKARAVKKGRVLQIKATVRDERPTGYFPTSYAGVRLEKRVHRKWSPIRGTVTRTNASGAATLKFKGTDKKTVLRVTTLTTDDMTGSSSAPFTIKVRR